MQVPQNGPARQGQQSTGVPGAPTENATTAPSTNLWSTLPSQYRPILAGFDPTRVNGHDRIFNSLLSATPDRVRFPPVQTLPTTLEELYIFWCHLCIEIESFTDSGRKSLISTTPPVKITFDHVFFTLIMLKRASGIDASVLTLIESIQKMLECFWEWAASWGADLPLGPCVSPELVARDLKDQAAEVLARVYPLDDKSKWLYALLRALGHLPEVWGYQAPKNGSDDTLAAHDGQDSIKQESTTSENLPSPSGPSTKSSAGAPVAAAVGARSEPLCPLAPGLTAVPKGPKVPAGQTFPFYYYKGPNPENSNRTSALFSPQPSPNIPSPITLQEASVSLPSLASTSKISGPRASLSSAQRRVLTLEDIVRLERDRISGLEHMRGIAQNLTDLFFRGLFTQYSHQYLASQMSQAHREIVLKSPDLMIHLVKCFCEHMEMDVAILSKLRNI